MSNQYIDQYKRLERWYRRLEEIYLGREHNKNPDYYQDILYAFFQNCFHFKDWLIESGVISNLTVNTFINSEDEMKICRDLCNGSKHLVINNPSIDPNIKVNNKDISLLLSNEPPQIKIIYWIDVNGSNYLAFDVATRCLVLWKNFLKQNGITI